MLLSLVLFYMHTCTTKVSVKIFLNQSTGTVRDIDAHNDEEENMVHDEEENIVHDEEENIVHDEEENMVHDEEENMVHDEEENIVHDEEENMVHDEVENVVLVNVILGAADGDDALFELRGILSLC